MTRRLPRLNKQLQREITRILRDKVRDPRVGFPSVTEVRVTNDLFLARVFVRVAGDEAERREALKGLETAAPFVRKSLGAELRIRRIPELRFFEDRTHERASRIEEILRDVLPVDEADESEEQEEADDASEGQKEP